MDKLRVLIVDDAVVVRRILVDALSSDPDLEVHFAPSGRIALAKLEQSKFDAVTLDIEMPDLDGLATLKEIRKTHARLPVIMFSTLAERGAAMTLAALAAGANDYVTKPANVGSVTAAIARIKDELVPRIKAFCGRERAGGLGLRAAGHADGTSAVPPQASLPKCYAPPSREPIAAVIIAVSTGGPTALAELLPKLPADLPVPVAVVQHMPPLFTRLLAERLDRACKLTVREGVDGTDLRPGQIVLAPGGLHMTVSGTAAWPRVVTNSDTAENSCRPAADVLLRSAVKLWGGRVLAVVLTGMGSDGVRGCEGVRQAGGRVIVQDEATSVVWGMPGAVARAGLADRVLPLDELPWEIVALSRRYRNAA